MGAKADTKHLASYRLTTVFIARFFAIHPSDLLAVP
jgi:hypothetical protein